MKVRNIKTGEVAECEWRTDHPESIRLTNLKAKCLRDLFGTTAQVDPEPVLIVKETGELFKCNPLMMEREGDPEMNPESTALGHTKSVQRSLGPL